MADKKTPKTKTTKTPTDKPQKTPKKAPHPRRTNDPNRFVYQPGDLTPVDE